MTTLAEIRKEAMKLSEAERAELADELIQSLPPDEAWDREGIEIAMRRNAEMEADPSCIITFDELKKAVGR